MQIGKTMITTDGYNNIDHFGDGYMEQEEEWEREGLLDPAWEKQQKKVSETMVYFRLGGTDEQPLISASIQEPYGI